MDSQQNQMNYLPIPDSGRLPRHAWITVDPAFGLKAHNDESSIAVHTDPSGWWDSLELSAVVHGHFDDVRLFQEVYDLGMYWNAWVWGVEAVAAQRVLISLWNVFLAQKLMTGRVEILPTNGRSRRPKIWKNSERLSQSHG
jgi:hypothetical protein